MQLLSAIGMSWQAALIVGLAAALTAPSARAVDPVPFFLNLQSNDGPTTIAFQAWIPDGVEHFRGMLVAFPGSGGDTRNIVFNLSWRRRLEALGFGIVGLRDVPDPVSYWGDTPTQGHANIQSMLDTIANHFGHPEISNAPLIMDGLSKGGHAAGYVSNLVQDRTICYVADKGFILPFTISDDFDVPGLMIGGQFDTLQPPSYLYNQFELMRTFDAKVALAVDFTKGHVATETDLRLAFMAQALRARYPQGRLPSLVSGNPLQLVPITSFPDVWLGRSNPLDHTLGYTGVGKPIVAPEADYVANEAPSSWLPTEAMAMVYQSHNDSTILTRPFFLTASNPSLKKHILLTADSFGINVTRITLFHDEELIAVLDPTTGQKTFRYFPRETGLHTFLAIAEFTNQNGPGQTSDYAVGIALEAVPEPATYLMAVGGLLSVPYWLKLRKLRRRSPK